MSLTARDRKIVLILIPIALVVAYWFLLLSPKRDEQAKIHNQLTAAQSAESTAATRLAELTAAKRSFASDFQTVISLGKSIPATLDMPSLLIQLNAAANGTGIDFASVRSGNRASAPGTSPSTSSPSSSTSPSPAGAVKTAVSSGIPGLDSVPLTFEFDGDFFRLADFFHAMKRFVQVVNSQIAVRGRLMTIDSFSFKTQDSGGNTGARNAALTATVQATVYLAPKAEGLAAGATAQGPAGAAAPATATAAASSGAAPTTPAATVTP